MRQITCKTAQHTIFDLGLAVAGALELKGLAPISAARKVLLAHIVISVEFEAGPALVFDSQKDFARKDWFREVGVQSTDICQIVFGIRLA